MLHSHHDGQIDSQEVRNVCGVWWLSYDLIWGSFPFSSFFFIVDSNTELLFALNTGDEG